MWSYEYEGDDYNVRDGVRAEVTGRCSKGLFLQLENGQEAFAYFGGISLGAKVLCTVLKKPNREKGRALVAVDSIFEDELAA